MALGAGETTPFRMTAAYSAFVNGGRRINPHLIEVVEDRDGKPIFNADQRDCPRLRQRLHRRRRPATFAPGGPAGDRPDHRLPDHHHAARAWSSAAPPSRRACWAGRSAARPAPPTTSAAPGSSASRPQIVVGVFVGFDDNRSLGNGETGAVDAVPIFIEFMQEALKGMPVHGLQRPAGRHVRPGRRQPRGLPARHRAAARPPPRSAARRPRRPVDAAQPLAPPPTAPPTSRRRRRRRRRRRSRAEARRAERIVLSRGAALSAARPGARG